MRNLYLKNGVFLDVVMKRTHGAEINEGDEGEKGDAA